MKLILVTAMAGMFLASSVCAQSLGGAAALPEASGKWTFPPLEDAGYSYPESAIEKDVLRAKVVLDCAIAADGSLKTCDAISEDPSGYGIGDATASMFVKKVHVAPETVAGGLKEGARQVFAYLWVVGRVAIDCTFAADGKIKGCMVVSEEPAGQGYGAATLPLIEGHAHINLKPGAELKDGTVYHFYYAWSLDEEMHHQ